MGAYLLAIRPKTLTAAMAPVLVGTAVAWDHGLFRPLPALAALVGALLLQVGANLANDYFDFVQGADTAERLGPTRAVQAGLLSASQVRRATVVVFALAIAVGAYLVAVGGLPVLAIGLTGIAAAVAYTAGGPWALGYLGLGDLFAFLYFGPLAVAGTYYVQALVWAPEAWLASLPIGCLIVAILVVNNLRDVDTDRVAGKRTLAVRFGRRFARAEYVAMLAVAFAVPLVHWFGGWDDPTVLFAWLSLPLAWPALSKVAGGAALGETARLVAVFGLLYALGIAL